jgi:uncharacterized protein YdhG (YjbR/CyaY superfamily)
MSNFPVIDTDGHVLERQSDIRKYLEEPWTKRPTSLWPGDQPWDNDMMNSFEMAREWKGLSAAQQVDRWHKIMDEHDIEKAVCFPTGSGNIAKNQEVPYQIAVTRAANAYKKGGFQFPEEQPVQLALLEHTDEAEVCNALDVLTGLLDEQPPIKLPVFEQRLKRLEDGAENPETRRRAAELRRVLRT